MSDPFSLIAMKSFSLLHFGQPGWLDIQVWMHPSQPIPDSQHVLTNTGGCMISLSIMHSKQSKISLRIAFCTALIMKKLAFSFSSTHLGNSWWIASATAMFPTSLISCILKSLVPVESSEGSPLALISFISIPNSSWDFHCYAGNICRLFSY